MDNKEQVPFWNWIKDEVGLKQALVTASDTVGHLMYPKVNYGRVAYNSKEVVTGEVLGKLAAVGINKVKEIGYRYLGDGEDYYFFHFDLPPHVIHEGWRQASEKEVGLYAKYRVERTDGSSQPGGKHDNCYYFVLDTNHDPYAIPALEAYAEACAAEYPLLASDLRQLIARAATPTPATGEGE